MRLTKVRPRALKDNPNRARQTKSSPHADVLLPTIKAVGVVQSSIVTPETDGGEAYIIDSGHPCVKQAIAPAWKRSTSSSSSPRTTMAACARWSRTTRERA